MVYKTNFLRFLNDGAEKTSQTEKSLFPRAEEKCSGAAVHTIILKEKYIHNTILMGKGKKTNSNKQKKQTKQKSKTPPKKNYEQYGNALW